MAEKTEQEIVAEAEEEFERRAAADDPAGSSRTAGAEFCRSEGTMTAVPAEGGMDDCPLEGVADSADLPQAADLPPSLRPLILRQALELSHAASGSEVSRLIAAIDEVLGTEPVRSGAAPKAPARRAVTR